MYNEEYLPQDDTYENDNYDDAVSISVSSADDSEVIVSKFNTQQKKQADSGYLKQKFEVDGELKKVESFATPVITGAKIRHAISGHRTAFRVGTDDGQYFSVVDTTSKDRRKLYYNTPEEFERHFYNTVLVPQTVKESWNFRVFRIVNKVK